MSSVWGRGRMPYHKTCPNGHTVPAADAPNGRAMRADEVCWQCQNLDNILKKVSQ